LFALRYGYPFNDFSKLMGFERVWAFERAHAENMRHRDRRVVRQAKAPFSPMARHRFAPP
jgi:hypothetical protein